MSQQPSIRDTASQDRVLEPRGVARRHGKLIAISLAVLVALTSLVIVLVRWSGVEESIDRTRVQIATVERGTFVRDVAVDGQVVAAISPTLYASASGTVSLHVHPGDTVSKGQTLAVLDSPDLQVRLTQETATLQALEIDLQRSRMEADRKMAQSQAALDQAQVDQKTAEREQIRSQKAYELGAFTELQTLKAKDTLEKADFSLREARMSYESQPRQNRFDIDSQKVLLDRQRYLVADLTRQVDGLRVSSPVDGQVGQVLVADRANVAKDAPLVSVIDLSALEVEIRVVESFAHDLHPGMGADLEGNGQHWDGKVSSISPEVVSGQVTARIWFLGAKMQGLRQNQRLAVRIFIDRRQNALTVDRGTFVDQDGGQFAYVVRQNIAERRAIRLGEASLQKVEILSGLAEGDQIVISGTDAFKGADRVALSH
jgi:HlyD family secretion protein